MITGLILDVFVQIRGQWFVLVIRPDPVRGGFTVHCPMFQQWDELHAATLEEAIEAGTQGALHGMETKAALRGVA